MMQIATYPTSFSVPEIWPDRPKPAFNVFKLDFNIEIPNDFVF
jgi:hypothetical protein